MKNKNILVIILIGIILAGGYFIFGYFSQDSQNTSMMSSEKTMKVSDSEEGIMGAVGDILSGGGYQKCTYEGSEVIIDKNSGRYYINGEMDGVETTAFFDGDLFYSWNSANTSGVKFSLECIKSFNMEPEGGVAEDGNVEGDEFQEFSYPEDIYDSLVSCGPYDGEVDFTAPSGIEFYDSCELLKNQMEMLKQQQGL